MMLQLKPHPLLTRKPDPRALPHCHSNRKRPLPPIEWLAERYSYDPDTGTVTGVSGRVLRRSTGGGYLSVCSIFDGRQVSIRQHRLAFALMTGRWPHLVDHIDGDKLNNRWINLREVSNSFNLCNRPCFPYWSGGGWRVKRFGKKFYFRHFCEVVAFNQECARRLEFGIDARPDHHAFFLRYQTPAANWGLGR